MFPYRRLAREILKVAVKDALRDEDGIASWIRWSATEHYEFLAELAGVDGDAFSEAVVDRLERVAV